MNRVHSRFTFTKWNGPHESLMHYKHHGGLIAFPFWCHHLFNFAASIVAFQRILLLLNFSVCFSLPYSHWYEAHYIT